MITNLITFAIIVAAMLLAPYVLFDMFKSAKGYLSNDLSRDGKHWSYDEVVVAAYVTIWQDDQTRLDEYYQAFIGSVLKRSDRAVAEQMRRIRSAATPNSIASEFIQEVAFNVAAMPKDDAEYLFEYAIENLGGRKASAQLKSMTSI